MPATVTREEFDELAEEVRGEKLVTRHILEQTRHNSDDLAALKTRTTRIEGKIDSLERKVDGLERKVDVLDRKFDGLVRELPGMIADTMREVLRERGSGK